MVDLWLQNFRGSILSLLLAPRLHPVLFCELGLFLAQPVSIFYNYFCIYSVYVCMCRCDILLDLQTWLGSAFFLLSKSPSEVRQ